MYRLLSIVLLAHLYDSMINWAVWACPIMLTLKSGFELSSLFSSWKPGRLGPTDHNGLNNLELWTVERMQSILVAFSMLDLLD
jgi:hypothetical protein